MPDNEIKTLRGKTGLSQADFGRFCGGIPARTIQNWECGLRTPPEWVISLIKYRVNKNETTK